MEANIEVTTVIELTDKDFKRATRNTFKKVMEETEEKKK